MSHDEMKRDIGAIANFALDASDLTKDEISDDLRSIGIDVDIIIPKMLIDVNKCLYNKSWVQTALENKSQMACLSKDVVDRMSCSKDELLEKIKEIVSSGQLQIQYRDYKDLTEDDLLGLLEDADFLRKLDESKRKS